MTIINGDPEVVMNFFVGIIPSMFQATVSCIVGAILICTINPWMLLATVLPGADHYAADKAGQPAHSPQGDGNARVLGGAFHVRAGKYQRDPCG